MIRFIGLLLTTASLGLGQSDLSLRGAVEQALQSHPLLAAASERIEVARGLRTQAGLMPNPKLILQSENARPYGNPGFVFWRDTDDFAYLQNTFETFGKRQRRVETAEESVRRSQLELELLRKQIFGRVSLAYWQAAGARWVQELLNENLATFRQIVDYHEIRVREGAMAEADLIRVRLEAQRLAIAANQALLEAERARINLFREMGQTEFPAVNLVDKVPGALDVPVDFDTRQALENRTEAKVARSTLNVNRLNVHLQQANGKPNVDVLFGYKRATGFDTLIGGLQIDLPFRNRNQGLVQSAMAEVRAAQSAIAATEAVIRAEVQAARTEYEIRRREIVNFYQPLLSRAEETYAIAQAAYREGGTDLLRLLDAQRVRIEAQISYARALTDLRLSIANAAIATGVEP